VRTVGVEEELLLVDARTLRLVPRAEDVLGAPARVTSRGTVLELEVKREQIEVVSPPSLTLAELSATIAAGRQAADEAARAVGARAVALASAPMPCSPHLVVTPRFDRMQELFRLTMDEQLTCGFHVHVRIDSAAEGVAVLDRLRPWLPVLLALSANSPFWQGTDTGFASYRYQAWGRWPTTGAHDRFESVEAYEQSVSELLAAGVCMDAGMVYFDARLSRHAPTVEVRIADVCLLPEDAATIAALVRALVETAATEWMAGVPADDVSTAILRLASWRASRFGLDQDLLDPRDHVLRPAADAVAALLDHVDRSFADPDERAEVRLAVQNILARGTGATLQRRALREGAGSHAVIADALERTHGSATATR
jgi:carboxylate-amine ligase